MGDYEITGNQMHDRDSALDYVMRVFEKRKKTEAKYGRSAEITDLVIEENITLTDKGVKNCFTANLQYDLYENGSSISSTDHCYVQGKHSKTKEKAIKSLDAEIFEKNKSGKITLQRTNSYNIIEDVRNKTFTAYCHCKQLFANDVERKKFESHRLDRQLDENSRLVDSWPEWKRGTRIS
ncbi:MAG: hypothetical protein HY363_00255 [Candidatus Aenigmarchaeota archaeon]|nr:hypothetical protein [Candidatus Aenigmarchaeota archaeon]